MTAAICLCASALASASDDGDFEYWAKASFRFPIADRWQFWMEDRLTFGDEARRLDDVQTDYTFYYTGLAEWFWLGFGFKQQFEKDGDDWLIENRPLVNLVLRTTTCGLTVLHRSRFEYRILEDEQDIWRYRSAIRIGPARTFTPLKISPYVAQEVFLCFNEEDFNQHRLAGGFFLPLTESVRLELFYLWKLDEEADDWHDTNIVGSYIHFQF